MMKSERNLHNRLDVWCCFFLMEMNLRVGSVNVDENISRYFWRHVRRVLCLLCKLLQQRSRMKKVIVLSIDGTRITKIPEDTFNDLTNLQELTIRKSLIVHLSSKLLSPLKHLRLFDAKYNKITKLDRNLFQGNQKLESVNFSGNPLKIIQVNFFELSKISEIYMFNCYCLNSYFLQSSATSTLHDLQKLITKRCKIQ